MGSHYEDAAAQLWKCRHLSTKAPNNPGIEMKCPSTRTLSASDIGRDHDCE